MSGGSGFPYDDYNGQSSDFNTTDAQYVRKGDHDETPARSAAARARARLARPVPASSPFPS
jgi:hypothetical protein